MNVSPRRVISAVFSLMLVVSLAACGDNNTAQPEATTEAPVSSASTPTAIDTPTIDESGPEVAEEHNAADVTFAQMMTIHHEGALEMAGLAAQEAQSEEVKAAAATIEAAQLPEIELMESRLTAWGEPLAPSAGHSGMDHGGMDMNGMSQEEVMAELADVSGVEFDKQFLTAMTAHHEGAVTMAEQELTDGLNPDALELAQVIIDAQTAEIDEMQELMGNR